jgi:sulfate permease, SulP family
MKQPQSRNTWFAWRNRVNRASMMKDAAAGLTGALIVLPQGMAYAMIAGLPPQFGLYCAIVPAIVAALLGSSWHLVSGPTAAISIVVFSALSPLAPVGSAQYVTLALTLGFMAGLVQLLVAALRLGVWADRMPHSVIVGFTSGAACLIAASQLRHFFGLPSLTDAGFFAQISQVFSAFSRINWAVTTVGASTLLLTLFAKRFLKPLPHMVVGMVGGALVAIALKQFGMDIGMGVGIALVGALPSALPVMSSPSWQPAVWQQLSVSALAVALLALTEAIAIAKAVGLRSGQTIHSNQEIIGQGASNVVGAFFSGYPSSGSFTRSGVNLDAGAQTPLAAVFAALLLMAILLLIAPLVAYLPIAAMAGVLLVVAYGLIDRAAIAHCFATRSDTVLFLVTFIGCLVLNIEWAVAAGVLLAVGQSLLKKYQSK